MTTSANQSQDRLSIDHIGYAVADIAAYLKEFVQPVLRPVAVTDLAEDPVQKVRYVFVTLADGSRIELLEPASESSPVSNALRKGRGGLYHVCYRVPASISFEQQVEQFVANGSMVIAGPSPAIAFGGRRIVFLFTPFRDMIELVEAEPPASSR